MGMVNIGLTSNDCIPSICFLYYRANKTANPCITLTMVIEVSFMPKTFISLNNVKASWGPNDCITME